MKPFFSRLNVIILAAVLTAAAAAGLAWRLSWPNDRAAVPRAVSKLLAEPNLHAKISLDINLPQASATAFPKWAVVADGTIRRANGAPEFVGRLTSRAEGPGNIIYADGEVKLLSRATFFRLENVPAMLKAPARLMNKWTYVEKAALAASNPDEIKQSIERLADKVVPRGKITQGGQKYFRYTIEPDQEAAARLVEALSLEKSDNRVFDAIARTLRANEVKSMEIWLDGAKRDMAQLLVTVGPAQADASATLAVEFKRDGLSGDSGEPLAELSVKPEIFSALMRDQ